MLYTYNKCDMCDRRSILAHLTYLKRKAVGTGGERKRRGKRKEKKKKVSSWARVFRMRFLNMSIVDKKLLTCHMHVKKVIISFI